MLTETELMWLQEFRTETLFAAQCGCKPMFGKVRNTVNQSSPVRTLSHTLSSLLTASVNENQHCNFNEQ